MADRRYRGVPQSKYVGERGEVACFCRSGGELVNVDTVLSRALAAMRHWPMA